MKGQECARSTKFKNEVEPGLQDFFARIVLPLSGPRPCRPTRQQSGPIKKEDFEDTSELDPEWTKRRLFGLYCFDLGHTVTKESNIRVKRREDQDWLEFGAEYGQVCLWGFFWGYWRHHHSKTIVRKPSEDICGLCYQFHLRDRMDARNNPENDDDDDDDDDASHEENEEKYGNEDGSLITITPEDHLVKDNIVANKIGAAVSYFCGSISGSRMPRSSMTF